MDMPVKKQPEVSKETLAESIRRYHALKVEFAEAETTMRSRIEEMLFRLSPADAEGKRNLLFEDGSGVTHSTTVSIQPGDTFEKYIKEMYGNRFYNTFFSSYFDSKLFREWVDELGDEEFDSLVSAGILVVNKSPRLTIRQSKG